MGTSPTLMPSRAPSAGPRSTTTGDAGDERLTREGLASALNLTAEQAEVLDTIAAGRELHGRRPGIREVTQALALKASFSASKPRFETGERSALIVFRNPYCTCPPCTCGAEGKEDDDT